MYIDATTSDFQGFDPSASGSVLPPVGIYHATLQVIGSEQGETNSKQGKFDITYKTLDSEIAGQEFKLTYNTGHSNPDTAKWAIQDVLRVVYGITGDKNIGRVNFDDKMYFRPFSATLTISEKPGKDKDGNTHDQYGKPIMWKNGKLTSIKPLAGQPQHGGQPAGQPQYNNNAQPQQAQAPVGQPQQGGAPSWSNRG